MEFDKGEQNRIIPKHKWGKAQPPESMQPEFQHLHTVSSRMEAEKSVASISQQGLAQDSAATAATLEETWL